MNAFGDASSAMQESQASLGSSMQGKTSEFGMNTLLSQWKHHLANKKEEKVHDHHLAKGKTRRCPQGRGLKQRNLAKGWEADDGLRGWHIFIGKAAA